MSTAAATPDLVQDPKFCQRPVKVEIGYLQGERHRLRDLSQVAEQMADGLHRSPTPFAVLRNMVAYLNAPIPEGSKFANFDLEVGPRRTVQLHGCTVSPDLRPPNLQPGFITDRLYDTASGILTTTRHIAFTAAAQFRDLDTEAARTPRPWRDLFQAHIAKNPHLPDIHRERTLALAYAHAAINVHDYEPAIHPRQALQLAARHADSAITSIAKYCGTGGFKSPRDPAVDPVVLKKHLVEAVAWTTDANALSAKFSKRHGLVLAEDFLSQKS